VCLVRLRRRGNPLKLDSSGPAKGDPPFERRAYVWLEEYEKGVESEGRGEGV
jgi:hypothetical protein